jgi:hypothetical protein
MKLTSKEFWVDYALERAIKTFAQTGLAVFGGSVVNIFDVDWSSWLGVTLGATVLSILTSIILQTRETKLDDID